MSQQALENEKKEMEPRSTSQQLSASNTGAAAWSTLTSSKQTSFIFGSISQLENLHVFRSAYHARPVDGKVVNKLFFLTFGFFQDRKFKKLWFPMKKRRNRDMWQEY